MNLTQKQKAIMALIIKANPDGSHIDIDQLLERLPYVTSKESMQFSVRALQKKSLIEKDNVIRRDRKRVVYKATPLGEHWSRLLCPVPVPMTIEEAMSLEELKDLEKELGFDL